MNTYTLTVMYQKPLSMYPTEIEDTYTFLRESRDEARTHASDLMIMYPDTADALLETADGEELPF